MNYCFVTEFLAIIHKVFDSISCANFAEFC